MLWRQRQRAQRLACWPAWPHWCAPGGETLSQKTEEEENFGGWTLACTCMCTHKNAQNIYNKLKVKPLKLQAKQTFFSHSRHFVAETESWLPPLWMLTPCGISNNVTVVIQCLRERLLVQLFQWNGWQRSGHTKQPDKQDSNADELYGFKCAEKEVCWCKGQLCYELTGEWEEGGMFHRFI